MSEPPDSSFAVHARIWEGQLGAFAVAVKAPTGAHIKELESDGAMTPDISPPSGLAICISLQLIYKVAARHPDPRALADFRNMLEHYKAELEPVHPGSVSDKVHKRIGRLLSQISMLKSPAQRAARLYIGYLNNNWIQRPPGPGPLSMTGQEVAQHMARGRVGPIFHLPLPQGVRRQLGIPPTSPTTLGEALVGSRAFQHGLATQVASLVGAPGNGRMTRNPPVELRPILSPPSRRVGTAVAKPLNSPKPPDDGMRLLKKMEFLNSRQWGLCADYVEKVASKSPLSEVRNLPLDKLFTLFGIKLTPENEAPVRRIVRAIGTRYLEEYLIEKDKEGTEKPNFSEVPRLVHELGGYPDDKKCGILAAMILASPAIVNVFSKEDMQDRRLDPLGNLLKQNVPEVYLRVNEFDQSITLGGIEGRVTGGFSVLGDQNRLSALPLTQYLVNALLSQTAFKNEAGS